MIFFFGLLFVVPALAVPSSRIVAGKEATAHEFPYMISMQHSIIEDGKEVRKHFCGGSIINENWILTAAHCIPEVIPNIGTNKTEIVAGAHSIATSNKNEQRRLISKMIKHAGWVPDPESWDQTSPNDVAVIKVDKPFVLNEFVKKTNLPSSGPSYPKGSTTISGWGSTSRYFVPEMPDKLQKADLDLLSKDDCLKKQSNIHDTNLCAGNNDGKSVCGGDSGGPLVQKNDKNEIVQIGLVSWGWNPCGQKDKTGVFTNLSYFFEWIQKQIKE